MFYKIFLDIDGTLINYRAELPPSAKLAVEKALENGHEVYVCTGCSLAEIEARNLGVKLTGIIGGNGCYIYHRGKTIYHKTLSLEECTHFVNWCKDNNLAFRLECNSGMYLSDDYFERSKIARYLYTYGINADLSKMPDMPFMSYWHEGENLYRDDVNKTAFVLNDYSDYLRAKEEFKDLKVDTWGGKGEHALYGAVGVNNVSKAMAINMLKEEGFKTIAFGDAAVDIPMFQVCDESVAMGNASAEVKEKASYVTADVDQDGLYLAFKHFNFL
ncbi:MAG: HAD family hydrolase [Solobacterium sp.]|nr:HAD family hydrolase [Solobacterium sp.]